MKGLIRFIGLALPIIFLVISGQPVYALEEFKPILSWQRSKEAPDKIVTETVVASKLPEALALPLDPAQVVFDNGIFTPQVNKNAIPAGTAWSSWKQYSSPGPNRCGPTYELRHFQAKFTLASNFNIGKIEKVKIKSPNYSGDTFPINDNAYVHINGNFIKSLGTRYGARNLGFGGSAPYANETDGWVASGDLGTVPIQYLHTGQNTIDIVAGETCWWGGMGKLELVLELEGKILPVPYFSQKDPIWGSLEYDSGNSLELWCGNTIAQCGCALTSAAMLLKYYGVDRSPTGEPTNPETLNKWLKNRPDGYINGDINWQTIARYTKDANEVFQTPKIDFLGTVIGPKFDTLDNELNLDRPVILQESFNGGIHFVIATGSLGITYSINDPISTSNTMLNSYGNTFQGIRRYALTNTNLSAIILSIPNPGTLLLIDSQGRKLGQDLDTGEVFNDIPNGNYYLQTPITDVESKNPAVPPEGVGNYYIEILDPLADKYTIKTGGENLTATFLAYDQLAEVNSAFVDIFGKQEFLLDYSQEPGSTNTITQVVDIDIKPGVDTNLINPNSKGVIPVAILTTQNFDATQVDPLSVKFGANQTVEFHNQGHSENVDGDGDIDLLLHFKTQEVGTQNTDVQICLTGMTNDQIYIQGCDSIKIVSK